MSRAILSLSALILVSSLCAPAWALELGDDAPPIAADKWLKGDPVDLAAGKGKHVYILEFWATWCGPCRESIPDLTRLQRQHKDKGLVVIGMTSGDENVEVAERFVKRMGDRMAYTVAYESKKTRPTADAYMKPFKVVGIPHAFIIDRQGKLVWQGHPMLGMDAVIERVLEGESDIKKLQEVGKAAMAAKVKVFEERQEALEAYFELVGEADRLEDSKKAGEKLLRLFGDDLGMHVQLADGILNNDDVKTQDVELALAAATRANELSEGIDTSVLTLYALAQFTSGQVDKAVETQKKVVELLEGEKDLLRAAHKALARYEAARKKS